MRDEARVTRRAVLLAACAAPAAAAAAPDAAPVTVILDWLLNADHAGLFGAEACGAFARAGLAVRLVAPSDPSSPVRLLAAGQADFAIGYGAQLPLVAAAGLPVVRVATVIRTPLDVLLALAGRGIRTLADLRGRTIGYSVPGIDQAILFAMLRSAGLAEHDVRVVDVNYALVASLLTGRVDAVIGAYRNDEVLQVGRMGHAPVVFAPEDHGVPPTDELVLLARRDRVGDGRTAAFVRALAEGVAAVQHDGDGMWRRFAARHPELDSGFNRASWAATVPLLEPDPGRLDAARYERFSRFCLAAKLIAEARPLGDYAVQIVP